MFALDRDDDGSGRRRTWLYLFLATASHGVLDAMTSDGGGIAFVMVAARRIARDERGVSPAND